MVGPHRFGQRDGELNLELPGSHLNSLFEGGTVANIDPTGGDVVLNAIAPRALLETGLDRRLPPPLPASVFARVVRERAAKPFEGLARQQIGRRRPAVDKDLLADRSVDRLPRGLILEHVDDPHGRGQPRAGRGDRPRDEWEERKVVDRHATAAALHLDPAGGSACIDDLAGEGQPGPGRDVGFVEQELARLGIEGHTHNRVAYRLGLELVERNSPPGVCLAAGLPVGTVGGKLRLQGRGDHKRPPGSRSVADEQVAVDVDCVGEDRDLLGSDRRGLGRRQAGVERTAEAIAKRERLEGGEPADRDLFGGRAADVPGCLHVEHGRPEGHVDVDVLGGDRAEHAERAAGVGDRHRAAGIARGRRQKHRGACPARIESLGVGLGDRDRGRGG